MIKTGIGQDSHRFDYNNQKKKLVLGGVVFPGNPPLVGNSDADVIFHAITNAISSISGVNIIGKVSDEMCAGGITDSQEYLKVALKHMDKYQIGHVAISIECHRPSITPKIPAIKASISKLLNLNDNQVGITATSGEGLTAFGRGDGIQVIVIITAYRTENED